MRSILLAAALCALAFSALAQQSGVVQFDPPNTGGAPAGYRLYRDNVLVGAVTPGQAVSALFPSNTGTWVIGVEAFNATGAGPRVNKSVTLGVVAPGPVRNFVITLNCAGTSPPTCTVVIADAP